MASHGGGVVGKRYISRNSSRTVPIALLRWDDTRKQWEVRRIDDLPPTRWISIVTLRNEYRPFGE